jgi:methylmalonyl-CoA/ethylmalonyl-CoA epimerase
MMKRGIALENNKNLMGTDIVAQIAVLVNDIEKTSQAYADFFAI